ncbi:MAG: M1 family peptidase, partial [Cyclonatronaceae bacterium]
MFLVFTACVTQQPEQVQQDREVITVPVQIERDLPNTIEIPSGYQDAIRRGTRTLSGTPGPDYWQQYATYDIQARLHPDTRTVSGSAKISYANNSPDTLRALFLEL